MKTKIEEVISEAKNELKKAMKGVGVLTSSLIDELVKSKKLEYLNYANLKKAADKIKEVLGSELPEEYKKAEEKLKEALIKGFKDCCDKKEVKCDSVYAQGATLSKP